MKIGQTRSTVSNAHEPPANPKLLKGQRGINYLFPEGTRKGLDEEKPFKNL
jgi:hypothetical protein